MEMVEVKTKLTKNDREWSKTAIEALKKLQEASETDIDTAHYQADEVLCKILNMKHFDSVVTEYKKIRKIYS